MGHPYLFYIYCYPVNMDFYSLQMSKNWKLKSSKNKATSEFEDQP